jgi:hypothetical protein
MRRLPPRRAFSRNGFDRRLERFAFYVRNRQAGGHRRAAELTTPPWYGEHWIDQATAKLDYLPRNHTKNGKTKVT